MSPSTHSSFRIQLCSVALFVLCLLLGCADPSGHPASTSAESAGFSVRLTKWYGGHSGTVSFTYDHGLRWLSWEEKLIQDIVVRENIAMDFDFSNTDFDAMPSRRRSYLDTLIPKGIRVFGHGYEHINSDAISEDSARINFRRCYDDMVAGGLKPVAYAYPGGDCYRPATRRALAASGFLSGRRFSSADFDNPYISPGDQLRPDDWFNLPCLIMFSEKVEPNPRVVHNTAELLPFLDEAIKRRAWLITTYHEIKDGVGGTYRVDDFRNDIAAVKERDFWIASFNAVTLYLHERERASAAITTTFSEEGTISGARITLSDNLPNDYYDHPLTLELSVPPELIGRRVALYQEAGLIQSLTLESNTLLLSLVPNEQPYDLYLL